MTAQTRVEALRLTNRYVGSGIGFGAVLVVAIIMAISASALGVIALLWVDDRASGYPAPHASESRRSTGSAVDRDPTVVEDVRLHRPADKWM